MPGLLLGRHCRHPLQQGSALGRDHSRMHPLPRAGMLRQAIANHGTLVQRETRDGTGGMVEKGTLERETGGGGNDKVEIMVVGWSKVYGKHG